MLCQVRRRTLAAYQAPWIYSTHALTMVAEHEEAAAAEVAVELDEDLIGRGVD